jgi:hypothetical protein
MKATILLAIACLFASGCYSYHAAMEESYWRTDDRRPLDIR